MSSSSTTFTVLDIPLATSPLSEISACRALEYLLSNPEYGNRRYLEDKLADLQVGAAQSIDAERHQALIGRMEAKLAEIKVREAQDGIIEASSHLQGLLVDGCDGHPLIAALQAAFEDHRPICMSPDMVWLLLCQGVAHHINANAETLRGQFVRHEGKAKIEIRRDDFIKGYPDNPWDEVIDTFTAQVREHVGPRADDFRPVFSTTDKTSELAAGIVLLSAVQRYFNYLLITKCGIPQITLEGTLKDWQLLATRAETLASLGPANWLNWLRPILAQFVEAAAGKIELAFWRSMFTYNSYSGGGAITGWIGAFFPYLADEQGQATELNPWLNESAELQAQFLAGEIIASDGWGSKGLSPKDFPPGLSCAPFTWKYLDENFPMEFLAGFVGVCQMPGTLALRPEIGWVVRSLPE